MEAASSARHIYSNDAMGAFPDLEQRGFQSTGTPAKSNTSLENLSDDRPEIKK
jgi:hypothetical protein